MSTEKRLAEDNLRAKANEALEMLDKDVDPQSAKALKDSFIEALKEARSAGVKLGVIFEIVKPVRDHPNFDQAMAAAGGEAIEESVNMGNNFEIAFSYLANWVKSDWIVLGICLAMLIVVTLLPVKTVIQVITFGLPVLLLLLAAILIGTQFAGKDKNKDNEEERGIVYQVPNNHVWVLRNVWSSDPTTGAGYQAKPQGWRFKVPTVLHKGTSR